MVHPGQEVELSDGAGLVSLQVLQVEAPYQEVLTPDVLRHQIHLNADKQKIRLRKEMRNMDTFL